jgi:hypothetical protein
MPTISKRKLESYKRAEKVAREFRYQMSSARYEDWNNVAKYVIHWMDMTGKIKYERPKKLRKVRKVR